MYGDAITVTITPPTERALQTDARSRAMQRVIYTMVLEREGWRKLTNAINCYELFADAKHVQAKPSDVNYVIPSPFMFGSFAMWQKCDTFIHGGCLGTVPFETFAECRQAKCGRSQCVLTKDDILSSIGPVTCAASWTSWFYNKKTGKCESFSYSGCSNLGPFESAEECKSARCRIRLCAFRKPTLTDGCELGNLKETWYYDIEKRRCSIARGDRCIYGEVFQSNMECRRARCHKVLCDMTEEDVTYQPSRITCGPAPMPWVYNKKTGNCEQFRHVGCEKRLPFATKNECKRKCGKKH